MLNEKQTNFEKKVFESKIKSNDKYILYIGRLEKIKGIKTLLSALKGLSIPLKIVGKGNLKDELQTFINENGLNTVELLGHKDQSEVYDLILMLNLPSVLLNGMKITRSQ